MTKPVTTKDLLAMELHEIANLDSHTSVIRVFGGWIYLFATPAQEGTDFGVFVPQVQSVEVKKPS